METPSFIASVEAPGLHELWVGRPNLFEGFALNLEAEPFRAIEVRSGDLDLGRFPANEPSPDIHRYLPRHPASDRCRFRFEVEINPIHPISRSGASPPPALFPIAMFQDVYVAQKAQ